MQIQFHKYQGAGNDFVLLPSQPILTEITKEQVALLCHRRFGVGADGVLWHQKDLEGNDKMVYYNSDGALGSMCGNGGRCFVRYLHDLSPTQQEFVFEAADGRHCARVKSNQIELEMSSVKEIQALSQEAYFLDTGSPHHVVFVPDIEAVDVQVEGARIRYSSLYPKGTNVNFVECEEGKPFKIRTYERGVEAETYACGTGAVAAVLAAYFSGKIKTHFSAVQALGGRLDVSFQSTAVDGVYEDIRLAGPAVRVFSGVWNLN